MNTEEQQAAIEAAASKGSIALDALAGTGKTYTLVQMAAKQNVPTLAVAFNKKNAMDLQARMPSHVTAKTMNGLGHGALMKWWNFKVTLDTSKVEKLVTELLSKEQVNSSETWTTVRKLVHSAKATGIVPSTWTARPTQPLIEDTAESWADLADYFDIEANPSDISLARRVLHRSNDLALSGVIDFGDQIYLSVVLGTSFQKYDCLIVDEAQDLSPLQHKMVAKSLGYRGMGRTAGDEFQAIYAWRGAASDSIHRLREQFKATSFPLTYCFRCSESVVEEAQTLVPAIRVPPGTRRGSVEHHAAWDTTLIPPGSAIICRNNAPLIRMAFRLLRERRGFQMLGRDFGSGLKKLIKDLKASSIPSLIDKLEEWRITQHSMAMAKFNYQKAEMVNDKASAIAVIAEEARDLEDLIAILDSLFNKVSQDITLSTGHRSKGLEWSDVFFLDSHLLPGKWDNDPSSPPWMAEQARNLGYVIRTRAQDNLHYVTSDGWNI